MASTPVRVTELDKEAIKTNLRTYLEGQAVFSGYNFEGPALAVLLDLLAQNTYLNSVYNNMQFSEEFIDSAVLRESVVSRAKELGYIPRSAKSSQAKLKVVLSVNDSPAFITMDAGTRFKGSLDNNDYYFTNPSAVTLLPDNGTYTATFEVYEGDLVSDTITVSGADDFTHIIRNVGVDSDSIVVTVVDSASSSVKTIWSPVTDITEVTRNSPVFFLQENMDGFFEIGFGDGVLGKKLSVGNIVTITYRVCNGDTPNGITRFDQVDDIGGYGEFYVSTVEPATGGQQREDAEAVRFNAPKYFARQKRTVISSDHAQLVKELHADIEAVSAWGGEENETPMYGRVYMCLKPKNGYALTQTRKAQIVQSLDELGVLAINPVVVDPTFLYIVATIGVNFDPNSTTLNAASVRQLAAQAVIDYERTKLGHFDLKFRNSRLEGAVDNADQSIKSVGADFLVQKRFTPILNAAHTYTLPFHFALKHPYDGYYGCLTSSAFRFPTNAQTLYLDDDGNGKLRAYYISGTNKVYLPRNLGTIDYKTGRVDLKSFNPVWFEGSEFKVNVQSAGPDITPVRNQIILIADSVVNIYDDNTGNLLSSGTVITGGSSTSLFETPVTQTIVI